MKYTAEFMELYKSILADYTNNFFDEKNEQEYSDKKIKDFNLPAPKFSVTLIKAFMNRNRLSWRRTHFAHRGKIDPSYVNIYLNQIWNAATIYSWNRVFNMDETCVHVNNGSVKTVAPIGVEQIVVDKQRNEKECFTIIGTRTRYEACRLIVVSNGTQKK